MTGITDPAATEATAGAASPGTATAASGPAAGETPSDYLGRVRAGGDFATAEVTKHQSRADQAEANFQKTQQWLGSLEQYRDQFTGEDIMGHLQNYNRILTDPKLRSVVDTFLRTGTATLPGATDTDGDDGDETYLSDEQKEIRMLRTQLSQMDSRVASQESGAGAQALKQHLESFFSDYPSAPDTVERVRQQLTRTIQGWASQGAAGRKALEALQGPRGREQVNGLALPVLTFDEQTHAIEQRHLRKKQGLSGLSTGGPSAGASTGQDPPPKFESALEALKYAEANPEGHNSY